MDVEKAVIETKDSYEKIDVGIKTDNFDDVSSRILKYSKLEEPDIKERLSIEKALSKYINCTPQTSMLALNLMVEILYNEQINKL